MKSALDSAPALRKVAMDLLARREHGRHELARKLRQRGVEDAELLAQVLDRLQADGLLSDERFVESLIRRRALSGQGPGRIRDELQQQGIERSRIQQALEASGFDWDQLLEEVWARKFAGVLPADRREQGRQMRFLTYRGFSVGQIQNLWRRHG